MNTRTEASSRVKRILGPAPAEYCRDIATLMTGAAIGQGIAAAATPVITRAYTPGELGALAVIVSLAGLGGCVVNGHYDLAVISAVDEHEALAALVGSVSVGLAGAVLFACGLVAVAAIWQGVLGETGYMVFAAVPLVALTALLNPLTAYNNRHQRYRLIAIESSTRPAIRVAAQLLFRISNAGVIGLAAAQVYSLLSALILQSQCIFTKWSELRAIRIKDVIAVLKLHRRQPLYSAPSLLAGTASYSMLLFGVSSLYGLREAGYYSVGLSVVGLPITLVSANVSRVFLQRAAREKAIEGDFAAAFLKTVRITGGLALLVFAPLLLVPGAVYEAVFGVGWSRAGHYAGVLAPAFATRFVASAVSDGLILENRQRARLIVQASLFGFLLVSYTISTLLELTSEAFLIMISTALTLTNGWLLLLTLVASKSRTMPTTPSGDGRRPVRESSPAS